MNSAASATPKENRREEVRRRVHYPAWIDRGDGSPLLDCKISDISSAGALLNVQARDTIPEQFVLLLSQTGTGRRLCRVASRSRFEISVQFVAGVQPAIGLVPPVQQSEPAPPPQAVDNTAELDC
jgi:hypothetical protein